MANGFFETSLKRPGGELATRPLHFIWMVDCSDSMRGEKIDALNHAIQSVIPDLRDAERDNPNAQLLVRTLRFSTGASWLTPMPVAIEDFAWDDLSAGGRRDMGKAFGMVAAQLTIPPMSERALPPVIVLLAGGLPTDDYKPGLNRLLSLPWGKKAVKIAISVGRDADIDMLQEFTGNRELVLQANNAALLTKFVRWASTAAVTKRPEPDINEMTDRANHHEMSGSRMTDQILPQIIRDFPDAVTDRKKLNALLLDFMPYDKPLRHTLLEASAEGIVRELAAVRKVDELSFRRYVKILTDGYGIRDPLAEQAVRLWMEALGVEMGRGLYDGERSPGTASGNGPGSGLGRE